MPSKPALLLALLALAPLPAFAECCEGADAILSQDDEWIVCEYTYTEKNRVITRIEAWNADYCSAEADPPQPEEEVRP